MNEEVKFIRGNDCINRLAQRPGIAAEVAVTLAAAVPDNRDTTVTFCTCGCRKVGHPMRPGSIRGGARRAGHAG